MEEHAVVIVGAGPTGMMLAAELALAQVDAVVLERDLTRELGGSRARGLNARTLEVLDQRGVGDRFLEAGRPAQIHRLADVTLDLSDFPTRHPYGLALLQGDAERILAAWLEELEVRVDRGCEVTGLAADPDGVTLEIAGERHVRARYVVGCDGGRSLVRRAAGIAFPGCEPETSWLIAEVEMSQQPEFGLRPGGGIGPGLDPRRIGLVVPEPELRRDAEPTLEHLRTALIAAEGTDYGLHDPAWISRFTDMTRQAAAYRRGRVLLAGDAAHVHPPHGGQGLGLGVQDAMNLGWKLAAVVRGSCPDALLDTYTDERHPIAAWALRHCLVQVALARTDPRSAAVRDTLAEVLVMDGPRRRLAGLLSGLELRYDLGESHPLLGRRMPDLELASPRGPLRTFSLLHDGRSALINFGAPGSLPVDGWSDRVQFLDARVSGRDTAAMWELPVIGGVPAPAAVLVRPDGYVAWVGEGTAAGLAEALTRWCGPAAR